MRLYELNHGDILCVSSKVMAEMAEMNDGQNLFVPLRRFRHVVWYKPSTWRWRWKVAYYKIG